MDDNEITRDWLIARAIAEGVSPDDFAWTGPGKYDGNTDRPLAVALDMLCTMSYADETTGHVESPTGHVARLARWLVCCDEQGFITATEYQTIAACEKDFAALEAEYIKWADASEPTFCVLAGDDCSDDFSDYANAVAYANELADELEELGYVTDRSWASRDNLYAIDATHATRIHRTIEVVRVDNLG